MCHAGFKLANNNVCEDTDECKMMFGVCRNGRCRNTDGSFTCQCADGYVLTPDGHNCKDVDECEVRTILHICSAVHYSLL